MEHEYLLMIICNIQIIMYANLVCSLLQVKKVGTNSSHKALSTLVEQMLERTRVEGRKPRFIWIMTSRELCRKVTVGSSSIMKYREGVCLLYKDKHEVCFRFRGVVPHTTGTRSSCVPVPHSLFPVRLFSFFYSMKSEKEHYSTSVLVLHGQKH